ncbi:hypothetical protein B0H12DRAFT_1097362 [Mycena haematopus]|nr:hypothetical protein B0H12DRAFT_1097362 [Mycena haematopus]
MPIVHYRPRFPAAVVAVPPATLTKPVVPTKPTIPVPPVTAKTSPTRAVVTPTKTAVTTKPVVPPTTKATVPVTPPVVPSTTLPLTPSTTSSVPIIPSTTPLSSSSTPTTPINNTASKATLIASPGAPSTSSSASASPSSATSVTALAAGIIGGLAGVIITGVLVAFFLRRWHRDRRARSPSRDSMNFDAKNFRRSGIMLESSPPPRVPEFGTPSVRSVHMDYPRTHSRQNLIPQHQYQQYQQPFMHSQPQSASPYSPYSPDNPTQVGGYAYPIPANPSYMSPGPQDYPPELHRQGIAGAAPHYQYQNNEDAYGGI